jgi:hypothetical protein
MIWYEVEHKKIGKFTIYKNCMYQDRLWYISVTITVILTIKITGF